MASDQRTIDFLLEQMAGAGPVSARKMFGEYALSLHGKIFALVCDDRLFLKPTQAGRAFAPDLPDGIPYPRAKPWLNVGGERWDEAEWLSELVGITLSALPEPTPRKPAKARRPGARKAEKT